MQQLLRERRRDREARLLDLGALVYELHRQGKRAPELLQSKAAELELIDSEVRELEAQLNDDPQKPRESATSDEPVPWEEDDTQEADALDSGDSDGADGGGHGDSD